MTKKRIAHTSIVVGVTLLLLSGPSAFASEVVGTLSSQTAVPPVVAGGTGGGTSSTVSGSISGSNGGGGGSTVSGTISGDSAPSTTGSVDGTVTGGTPLPGGTTSSGGTGGSSGGGGGGRSGATHSGGSNALSSNGEVLGAATSNPQLALVPGFPNAGEEPQTTAQDVLWGSIIAASTLGLLASIVLIEAWLRKRIVR